MSPGGLDAMQLWIQIHGSICTTAHRRFGCFHALLVGLGVGRGLAACFKGFLSRLPRLWQRQWHEPLFALHHCLQTLQQAVERPPSMQQAGDVAFQRAAGS